jgi:cytidylate kinase
VAVDGPSGSGKSAFSDRLSDVLGAAVLRLDDLVPGWHGLAATPPMVAHDVLAHLAVGETGHFRRWDWTLDRPGELVDCPPVTYLVLDGCGSGARIIRPFLSFLVWIDGPEDVRRERAMARDGDVYGSWWDVWAAQEREHFAAEQTKGAADLRLRSS